MKSFIQPIAKGAYSPVIGALAGVTALAALSQYGARIADYNMPRAATRKRPRKPRGKSRRSRRSYRKRSKKSGAMKQVEKRLRNLSRSTEANMGELVFRDVKLTALTCPVNESFVDFSNLNTKSNLEKVIAQLRFYDPNNPASLVVSNFNEGTYHKEVMIESSYLKLTARSNYLVPIELTAYDCRVKLDTSNGPVTAMVAGVPDVSNTTSSSYLIYPTDVPLVTDLWALKKIRRVVLQPGEEAIFIMAVKTPFSYDPSLSDTHDQSYQRRFKGCGMMLRLTGRVAHDSLIGTQFGISEAKIDILRHRTWRVRYHAGADIKYFYIDDQDLDDFTNQGDVCNRHVPIQSVVGS